MNAGVRCVAGIARIVGAERRVDARLVQLAGDLLMAGEAQRLAGSLKQPVSAALVPGVTGSAFAEDKWPMG